MKIVEKVKTVFAIIGLVVVGIFTGIFFKKKPNNAKDFILEKAEKEKKNEIEKTDSSNIVSSSCSANMLERRKAELKDEFRRNADGAIRVLHKRRSSTDS
ncbi:MAG: hypothetical protein ACTTHG_03000 [Treponemataceae bacterium]